MLLTKWTGLFYVIPSRFLKKREKILVGRIFRKSMYHEPTNEEGNRNIDDDECKEKYGNIDDDESIEKQIDFHYFCKWNWIRRRVRIVQ